MESRIEVASFMVIMGFRHFSLKYFTCFPAFMPIPSQRFIVLRLRLISIAATSQLLLRLSRLPSSRDSQPGAVFSYEWRLTKGPS